MCHRFLIIKSFLDNQGCVVDLIKQTTDSSSLYPQIRTQWSLTDSQQLLLIKCFSHSSRYLHILKKTRYGASNTNVMNSKSFCWKASNTNVMNSKSFCWNMLPQLFDRSILHHIDLQYNGPYSTPSAEIRTESCFQTAWTRNTPSSIVKFSLCDVLSHFWWASAVSHSFTRRINLNMVWCLSKLKVAEIPEKTEYAYVQTILLYAYRSKV